MPCAHTGALKLSSAPSSTAYLTPSLRASPLAPTPFLGRSASSTSLINAVHDCASNTSSPRRSPSPTRSPARSLAHSRSFGSTGSSVGRSKTADRLAMREAKFDISSSKVDLQLSWSSRTHGDAVPWRTYRSYGPNSNGPIDLYRGRKPRWVATAPGTGSHPFERMDLPPLTGEQLRTLHMGRVPPSWNPQFVNAHHIDRNPVVNGLRKGLDNRCGIGPVRPRDPHGGDMYVSPARPE